MEEFEQRLLASVPALRRYARFLHRGLPDPEDLVQQTLEHALVHRGQYRPIRPLVAWLRTLMYNLFIGGRRRSGRDPLASGADVVSDWHIFQTAGQDDRVALSELADAVDRLPPAFRDAVLICGALGWHYDEASLRYGIPAGTLKSRLSRARRHLRAHHPSTPPESSSISGSPT